MDKERTADTVQVNTRKRKPFLSAGFTLVELLIAIGIIALLAAILLPTMSHARERGRRTVCQTNLRQIAAAIQQYVQDYDGIYIEQGYAYKTNGVTTLVSWQDVLVPYTKSRAIFRCPDQIEDNPAPFTGVDGYTLNIERLESFSGPPTAPIGNGKHESQLPNSSAIWLDMDRFSVKSGPCIYCDSGIGSCGRGFLVSTVHSGGGNYSFLDGHVKWLTPNGIAEVDCQNSPLHPTLSSP